MRRQYGNVRVEDGSIRIYDVNDAGEIVDFLMRGGITPSEVRRNRIGLEEYYIELMSKKEAS